MGPRMRPEEARSVFVGDGDAAGGWPDSPRQTRLFCSLPVPPPAPRSPTGEQESIFQASA